MRVVQEEFSEDEGQEGSLGRDPEIGARGGGPAAKRKKNV